MSRPRFGQAADCAPTFRAIARNILVISTLLAILAFIVTYAMTR